MGIVELHIFKSCVFLYLLLYFIWTIITDIFSYFIPCGIILSFAVLGVILYFRVPCPEKDAVNSVLGVDPFLDYTKNGGSPDFGNQYKMNVAGHRGCGFDAPENSLSAARKSAAEGCTAIEFDVVLSADNVPIIFHDEDLSRMTDLTTKVNEMTWAELQKLDISMKHPFGSKFRNERIPTLDEMVKTCLDLKMRMFLDLKGDNNKMVDVIIELFNNYPELHSCAAVSSFNPWLIYQIRQKNPRIVCTIAWRPYYYAYTSFEGSTSGTYPVSSNPVFHLFYLMLDQLGPWLFFNFFYYMIGISGVLLHKDVVTWEAIHFWRNRNVRVIAWSVNLPTEKQYFEKILKITYMTDTMISS